SDKQTKFLCPEEYKSARGLLKKTTSTSVCKIVKPKIKASKIKQVRMFKFCIIFLIG
ncbi:hypothetical protein LSH36_2170g00000, partial [Paralvinella palmiformis]